MQHIDNILNGNALSELKNLPDNSVDCIMTSPPYWGLRDYGTEHIIWGDQKECSHIWSKHLKKPNGGKNHPDRPAAVGANNSMSSMDVRGKGTYSNFCHKCGAWKGSLGLEPTFEQYIDNLIEIFAECKRVLKPSGTMWVNLGDTYGGSGKGVGSVSKESWKFKKAPKVLGDTPKSLCNIPSRFALAMTDKLNMVLRNEIVWYKPNAMPSSAKDRFTVDFEKVYFFSKSTKYYFKQQFEKFIINSDVEYRKKLRQNKKYNTKVPYKKNTPYCGKSLLRSRRGGDANPDYKNPEGRNMRTVWKISTRSFKGAHFATFPPDLVERCLKSGCPDGGVVLDPFFGAGTTGVVAKKLGMHFIGIELNKEYAEMAEKRIQENTMKKELGSEKREEIKLKRRAIKSKITKLYNYVDELESAKPAIDKDFVAKNIEKYEQEISHLNAEYEKLGTSINSLRI